MIAVELITEAVANRCRVKIACDDLTITFNTYLHWQNDVTDKRKGPRHGPANKLDQNTREQVFLVATSKDFMDLSPWWRLGPIRSGAGTLHISRVRSLDYIFTFISL